MPLHNGRKLNLIFWTNLSHFCPNKALSRSQKSECMSSLGQIDLTMLKLVYKRVPLPYWIPRLRWLKRLK